MGLYLLFTGLFYCSLGLILGLRLTAAQFVAESEPVTEDEPIANEEPTTIAEPEPTVAAEATESEPVNEEVVAAPQIIENANGAATVIMPDVAAIPTPELPAAWLAVLEDCQTCRSFVEASTQVLRLEVGRYRDQLVEIDTHVRVMQRNYYEIQQLSKTTENQEELNFAVQRLQQLGQNLIELNSNWLQRQNEALGVLSEKRQECAEFADLAERLENLLLDQVAQIETTENNLRQQLRANNNEDNITRLIQELQKLADLAHSLRDMIFEALIAIMQREDRLKDWSNDELTDHAMKLMNRAGVENWLREFRADPRNATRALSFAIVDIDQFRKHNQQWGLRFGDQLLAAAGPLLDSMLRKSRGFDMTVRFAGQRIAFVLPDTGPRGANSALERIRQITECSYFDHHQGQLQLTISAGVTDVRANDDIESLLDRLERALQLAKTSGRNRIALDEGSGPQLLLPPKLDIKPKVASLDD
jgi:diguanylate cyclase (GGDEF)-like protein